MADEADRHWIDVRMEVRIVEVEELKPGDHVWYYVRKFFNQKKLNRPDAHGPFEVTNLDPFKLKNTSGVEVKLDSNALILLLPTQQPPKLR